LTFRETLPQDFSLFRGGGVDNSLMVSSLIIFAPFALFLSSGFASCYRLISSRVAMSLPLPGLCLCSASLILMPTSEGQF
jgi:hypothetical protein